MDEPHYYWSIGTGDINRAKKREDMLKEIYQYFKKHPYSRISAIIHYWSGRRTTKTTAAGVISVAGKKVIAYETGDGKTLREIKSSGKLGRKIGIEYPINKSGYINRRFYWMKE